MEVVGKSPHFTIRNFELGYTESAKFYRCFANSVEDLLFPYFEVNLRNDEKEWKDFILNRTVFKSETWTFQDVTHKNVYWYRPKNEQELIKIIKNEGLNSLFYVVPSGSDIESYNYLIYVVEHVTDEDENDEYVAMFVTERTKGIFEKQVFPKLRKNFSELKLDSLFN
ncbi:hypothetical protein [Neobacillus massiliamazoniensis]|uniref:Uncharacterized protein n=1 Tax=Neobacillus massiliamazoniensis TaxID=1499688 RepID=A0A0U1P2X3_9BACI|nr:hypothetical protein [Neobacillus massiliamazoniensis]CRK84533.1 hypothetical protein BN000_04565 [Neobacillus massiliamazoniensis]